MLADARQQLNSARARRRLLQVLLVQDLADSLIALQEIVGAEIMLAAAVVQSGVLLSYVRTIPTHAAALLFLACLSWHDVLTAVLKVCVRYREAGGGGAPEHSCYLWLDICKRQHLEELAPMTCAFDNVPNCCSSVYAETFLSVTVALFWSAHVSHVSTRNGCHVTW